MATANFTLLQLRLDAVETGLTAYASNLDAFFLTVNGIICFFLQAGFALFECGAVRAKNATNILIKNLLDSFVGAIAYWILGFPLAYGGGNELAGNTFFAWSQFPLNLAAFWWFQYVFAATTATIVSGSLAERCDFTAYLIYSAVLTGIVYPVVSHWVWSSEGWLAKGMQYNIGNETFTAVYQDFAGSGAVHVLSGVVALAGAAILGPRLKRFKEKEDDIEPTELRGHSVPYAALGGFILVFGFFSFNGGSLGSMSNPGDGEIISRSVVNTVIAGSFGAVTTMIMWSVESKVRTGQYKWSLLIMINGVLTGMVASCSGVNLYPTWAAAVVGVLSGFTWIFWHWLMIKAKVDDPLDAIAVHAGGGYLGVIMAPILSTDSGLVFNWDVQSAMVLAFNILGVLAITLWSAGTGLAIFGLLNLFHIFRVDPEIEIKGLDIPKHGEPGYPVASYGDGWAHVEKLSPDDLGDTTAVYRIVYDIPGKENIIDYSFGAETPDTTRQHVGITRL